MFKDYIYSQKQNIISSICDLITYPTISEENANIYFPFGKACSDALKYFLHLAESLGFRTKNVDGYCGYAEFGQGDELIGIIGHLDVVPAMQEDWSYSPFTPTIDKNRIYGRGAIDDKGPVIASLYAMKAVMEYCKDKDIVVNKRIRLIVGLNEETNWKCIEYYKQHEEMPTVGFSPDADFPCIYAEKAVLSILVSQKLPNDKKTNLFQKLLNTASPIQIESMDCDNNAINVVPKICMATLRFEKSISLSHVLTFLKSKIDQYNYDIDLYKIDDSHLKITSYGIAAHSAHPDLGNNAITKLFVILQDLFTQYHCNIALLSTFCKYIGDHYYGEGLNLASEDESGKLTLNTSQCYLKDNTLFIGMNLRIPVKTSCESVIEKLENLFKEENITFSVLDKKEALYINPHDSLVQKLCSIFNESCGGTSFEPIAIGGATYARAFPNCISFGMNFPGDKDMCHQADEFVDIDKLILSTNIYAKAIYTLLS